MGKRRRCDEYYDFIDYCFRKYHQTKQLLSTDTRIAMGKQKIWCLEVCNVDYDL